MAGIIEVKDQGKVRIYDADNSNYVDIVVPSTVSSNRTITIPDATFTIPTSNTPDDDAITAAKLNNDIISGTTALTSEPADTDEFLVSDAGTLKRIDYSLIKGGGITEADQWRLTSSFANTGDNYVTSNWERNDNTAFAKLGTGLSESSGVFSFPSTGLYYITWMVWGSQNGSSRYNYARIEGTTDNSSYDGISWTSFGVLSISGSAGHATGVTSCYFNVTDVSTHKIKFKINTENSISINSQASGQSNSPAATFIRLGDAQ